MISFVPNKQVKFPYWDEYIFSLTVIVVIEISFNILNQPAAKTTASLM